MSLSGTTCTRDTSPLANISLTKSFQEMLPPLVLMEFSRLMMSAIMKSVRSRSRYIWSSCSRRFLSSEGEEDYGRTQYKEPEKDIKTTAGGNVDTKQPWFSQESISSLIPSSSSGVFPFGPLPLFFSCFDWDVLKKFVAPEIKDFSFVTSSFK